MNVANRWSLGWIAIVALVVGVSCTLGGAEEPAQNTLSPDAGDSDDAAHQGDVDDGGGEAVEIRFSEPEFVVERASPTRPTAEVIDDHGEVIEGAEIRWESENPAILEITSGGLALGHELGQTELIATHDELVASWPARVVGKAVDRVVVAPAQATVVVGWELPYLVSLYDANNVAINDLRSVAWSTTDESVATIDDEGVLDARAAGTVEVVARVEGVEDRATLTVVDAEVESLEIRPVSPSPIGRGDSLQLEATAYDLDGDPISGVIVDWSSSDQAVATVDEMGLVEGLGAGEATISAAVDELEDSVDITVIFTVKTVASGDGFGCAVAGGELTCWGVAEQGQLGAQQFDGQVDALSLGAAHGCLVDDQGEIWCWGANDSGQLGKPAGEFQQVPQALQSGLVFRDVDAGLAHTCGVTTDDEVYCWGENGDYQLGHSQASTHEPSAVDSGVAFETVSAGHAHSCAVAVDNTGYCWGANHRGQLGGDFAGDRSANPEEVIGGYSFNTISAGGDFNCGISASGPPVCWGANDRGQLGNGGTVDQDVPITLALEPGESLTFIAAGDEHVCGLVPGGQPRCWGAYEDGRLGRDADEDATTPEATQGDTAYWQLSAGAAHVCGRTPDHEVYCWGGAPAEGPSAVEVDL